MPDVKIEKNVPMANLVVEKNVPRPNSALRRGRIDPYIFKNMEVGDSVFFKEGKARMTCKPYAAAIRFGQNWNMKFSGASENNGVRIWRVL